MKTLEQLMSNTPSDAVKRSKETNARILSVKPSKKKGVDTLVFVVRCKANTETTFYDVVIELYPTEVHKDVFSRPSFKNPAWVQCSCPFFLFNCEYALAKIGSSEIKYSNGKPPVVTNPKMVPFLCKHLYKAAPEVVKQSVDASKREKKYDFVS